MNFKKLKAGGIVLISSTNPNQKTVYGRNLLSPKLKHRSIHDSSIDKDWPEDADLIRSIFEIFHSKIKRNQEDYPPEQRVMAEMIDNFICRLENLKKRRSLMVA